MAGLRDITIHARDGVELQGIVLSPDSLPIKAVIQFHAGTVVKKEFYLKFCTYVADQGYEVVMVDFRGVGASRPSSLRGFEASISDWGKKDAPAILDWIHENYNDLPVHLLAHSMGGQLIGLMDNWNLFDKITVIASSSGNWNNFESKFKKSVKWPSLYLYPILLNVMGYIPGKLGTGYDWPRGVAEEWRENSIKDSMMSDFMSWKHGNTQYQQVDKQIHAIFFSDDYMATPETVGDFPKTYVKADIVIHELTPEQFNLERLGHKEIFKAKTKGPLWDYVIETFD